MLSNSAPNRLPVPVNRATAPSGRSPPRHPTRTPLPAAHEAGRLRADVPAFLPPPPPVGPVRALRTLPLRGPHAPLGGASPARRGRVDVLLRHPGGRPVAPGTAHQRRHGELPDGLRRPP